MPLTYYEVAATWLINDWIECGQDLEYCERQGIFSYERKLLEHYGNIFLKSDQTYPVTVELRFIMLLLREAGATDNDRDSLVRAWELVKVARANEEAEEEAYNAS